MEERRLKISPSLMCVDFLNLGRALQRFAEEGIDYLHIDIMDGHYVPNFTLGIGFCEAVAAASAIPLDIHLMIEQPENFIPSFARFPDCCITFHPEVTRHPMRAIQLIRDRGARAGLALNPGQPIEGLRHLLPHVDQLCVLTVVPGFAGQKMVPGALARLAEAAGYVRENGGERVEIEVDGNVSWQNLPGMIEAGAQVFVAGTSSIFEKGGDLAANIRRFRALLDAAGPR